MQEAAFLQSSNETWKVLPTTSCVCIKAKFALLVKWSEWDQVLHRRTSHLRWAARWLPVQALCSSGHLTQSHFRDEEKLSASSRFHLGGFTSERRTKDREIGVSAFTVEPALRTEKSRSCLTFSIYSGTSLESNGNFARNRLFVLISVILVSLHTSFFYMLRSD